MKELWDIYTSSRERTGETFERTLSLPKGKYHLVATVCAFNEKGELLAQRRVNTKPNYPDMWDFTACGSALAGENSAEAAERELKEEMGITHDFSSELPRLSVQFVRGFNDFYILSPLPENVKVNFGSGEVQAVEWMSKDRVLSLIREGKFVPYETPLIECVWLLKDKIGLRKF